MAKPDAPVIITAGIIQAMTAEQFVALRDNVLAEGKWETADRFTISGYGFIGVRVEKYKRASAHTTSAYVEDYFIGIEKDGYTHS